MSEVESTGGGKKGKKAKDAAAVVVPVMPEPVRLVQTGVANTNPKLNVLGIDIGGTGIKGCVVNIETGQLVGDRIRIDTPSPSTPENCKRVVAEIAHMLSYTQGPVGITFPAVIQHGVTLTAANVDRSWINFNAEKMFREALGSVIVLNDADAAGIAEVTFGAGKGVHGTVALFTFGTGIGSAMFTNGVLLPNTELGHLLIRGKDAEKRCSEKTREIKGLKWAQWAERVNEYFAEIDKLFVPDMIIVGGGVSKKYEKYSEFLRANARLVCATLANDAGIVGAALAAHQAFK